MKGIPLAGMAPTACATPNTRSSTASDRRLRRAIRVDAPAVEHHDAAREQHRKVEIVQDGDHGGARAARALAATITSS